MLGITLPFEEIYDIVSLFSKIYENRKGNGSFLASKMYLDILCYNCKSVSTAVLIILQ